MGNETQILLFKLLFKLIIYSTRMIINHCAGINAYGANREYEVTCQELSEEVEEILKDATTNNQK